MLNIFYGDMKEAVYNTASYFKYDYEESWIIDPMVKEMIQDVDSSTVIDSGIIDSPQNWINHRSFWMRSINSHLPRSSATTPFF